MCKSPLGHPTTALIRRGLRQRDSVGALSHYVGTDGTTSVPHPAARHADEDMIDFAAREPRLQSPLTCTGRSSVSEVDRPANLMWNPGTKHRDDQHPNSDRHTRHLANDRG